MIIIHFPYKYKTEEVELETRNKQWSKPLGCQEFNAYCTVMG